MDGPSELFMYGRLTTQDVHRMWRGSSMTQKLPFSKIKLNLIIFLFYLNVWYASIEVRANVCISHPQCHKKPPATKSPFTSILKSPKNLSSVCAKKKTNIIFFVGAPLISGPQKFRVWTAPSTDWWGCQNFTNIECLMWVMRCVMIWRGPKLYYHYYYYFF